MKVLKTEKSNCGWFIRYEHFDWFTLLAIILIEIIPVYGIIVAVQNTLWILFSFSSIVAFVFMIIIIFSGKDHKFWFVIEEKFVTKITIPYEDE